MKPQEEETQKGFDGVSVGIILTTPLPNALSCTSDVYFLNMGLLPRQWGFALKPHWTHTCVVNLDKLRATDAIWYLSIADLDSAQYWALDCSVRFAGLVQVVIYSDDVMPAGKWGLLSSGRQQKLLVLVVYCPLLAQTSCVRCLRRHQISGLLFSSTRTGSSSFSLLQPLACYVNDYATWLMIHFVWFHQSEIGADRTEFRFWLHCF